MIENALRERKLPDLLTMNDGSRVTAATWPQRKQELIECLSENLFGYTMPAPAEVRATVTGSDRYQTYGGKSVSELIDLSFDTPGGEFTFPIRVVIPKNVAKPPVFLHIAFSTRYPVPVEEIIDNGFAIVQFHYHDVEKDEDYPENYFGRFIGGLGEKFFGGRDREDTEWGKVGLWAYAASRVMDYLQTREDINTERIAVSGHSRLGKTALWCKAQDPRFYIAFGNNTNYGGGGLIRGHQGEDVEDFVKKGSYDFFCKKWKGYRGVPHEELPFDQHFLMACHAPGLVYLSGATDDPGMDPTSEFLSCCAASEVYRMLGKFGLVGDREVPQPGQALLAGEIGFHIREGGHYLSREDWQHFMNFFKKHM